MIARTFQGGWYCDANDRGEIVLFPGSHLELLGQRVPLPQGQNVLFPALAADGIRFAGQGGGGAIDLWAMEWVGADWIDRGFAPGHSPVIYDRDDILRIRTAATGVKGFRYVAEDGRLVTGDETAADLVRRIWDYTELPGGLTVGQGGEGSHGQDPLIILHQGRRYRVQDGTCRFIRARRYGDQLVLAWWQKDRGAARVLRCTMAELAQFPIDEPEPQPGPHPQPEPDPMPDDIARYLVPRVPLVETVKRDYPHLRGGAIVDQVAHRLNREYQLDPIRFGRKARRADGSDPNEDCLTFRLDLQDPSQKKLIDILFDGGGADVPMWSVRPADEEPRNGYWTPPVHADLDETGPEPDPWPASIDALVQAWIAGAVEPLQAQIADLQRRLDDLVIPTPPPMPRKVAIKSSRGRYLRDEWSDDSARFDRGDGTEYPDAGSGETFTLDVME